MLKTSPFVKLRIIVPIESESIIREVLGKAGAGVQGNYDYCSFTYKVTGRFRPKEGANPAIGSIGQLEEVDEVVIETICHEDKLKEVISAVKQAHPYEEPAIDILHRLEIE